MINAELRTEGSCLLMGLGVCERERGQLRGREVSSQRGGKASAKAWGHQVLGEEPLVGRPLDSRVWAKLAWGWGQLSP